MNKYWLLIILSLALNINDLVAQNHFIFIQSETKKPFVVSVNDKKFNSTSTGYVIIPRLKSGPYDLLVDFKDESIPQSKFTTTIDRKDVGYTLKDLVKSSASLVDMQTYNAFTAVSVDTYKKNDNPAGAVAKAENEKSNASPNTTATDKLGTKKPVVKKPVAPAVAKLKKGVNKISESQADNNISMLFIDVLANGSDTIDVMIPVQKDGAFSSPMLENTESIYRWASFNEEDEFLQTGYNTKCVHLLTKEDMARLRKRMSAEINEDKMINVALKVTLSKCFTVADVKKLSALFVKEQGKLKLFNALYNYVYDYIDYPQLEAELSDAVNKEKFRSILLK